MSKKIEQGGRRVVVDLAPDAAEKLNKARIDEGTIYPITGTLEQIIRKANLDTLWN